MIPGAGILWMQGVYGVPSGVIDRAKRGGDAEKVDVARGLEFDRAGFARLQDQLLLILDVVQERRIGSVGQ